MPTTPDVRFARNGDVRLGWMQWGSGPDLLLVPGLFSHVEVAWEHEYSYRVYEWLGKHFRVTAMDKRGMGLSDRCEHPPTLDERVADIIAVMDAAGVAHAHVSGVSEAGMICQHLAVRHPERVDRLVLANSAPGRTIALQTWTRDDLADFNSFFGEMFARWGEDPEFMLRRFAPAFLGDTAFVRWSGRLQRLACTGHDVAAHFASIATLDVYDEQPLISVPTLVVNCTGDQIIPAAVGDQIAARIPDAERRTFEGGDHFFWFGDDWLDVSVQIAEFLLDKEVSLPTERRFASVVFTDIVGSTAATAAAGDAEWRGVLDQHDHHAWRLADVHRGSIVKSTGDGLLARFDSPHDAIAFSTEFRDRVAEAGLEIRAGVHMGEIEIRENRDITGVAVNLAARVEQAATDGAIYVSSTVRDMMLGGSVGFDDRGEHELKGIDGRWRLYEVASTTG